MEPVQEHQERPAVVSREYLYRLLSGILGCCPPRHLWPYWLMQLESMGAVLRPCPGHLLDAWIDYLEKKGVIVRNDQSYELAGQPDALGAYPDDARTSLHEAVIDHLQTADCPNLLRYAIPAIRSNGDSTTRKSVGRPSEVQSAFPLPATSNDLKRMRWERQRHLRELADFVPHAEIVFDWILATVQQRILSTASPPKKRQMSNEDRARLIQEHQAAHRQQIEDAMACADVPRLAAAPPRRRGRDRGRHDRQGDPVAGRQARPRPHP